MFNVVRDFFLNSLTDNGQLAAGLEQKMKPISVLVEEKFGDIVIPGKSILRRFLLQYGVGEANNQGINTGTEGKHSIEQKAAYEAMAVGEVVVQYKKLLLGRFIDYDIYAETLDKKGEDNQEHQSLSKDELAKLKSATVAIICKYALQGDSKADSESEQLRLAESKAEISAAIYEEFSRICKKSGTTYEVFEELSGFYADYAKALKTGAELTIQPVLNSETIFSVNNTSSEIQGKLRRITLHTDVGLVRSHPVISQIHRAGPLSEAEAEQIRLALDLQSGRRKNDQIESDVKDAARVLVNHAYHNFVNRDWYTCCADNLLLPLIALERQTGPFNRAAVALDLFSQVKKSEAGTSSLVSTGRIGSFSSAYLADISPFFNHLADPTVDINFLYRAIDHQIKKSDGEISGFNLSRILEEAPADTGSQNRILNERLNNRIGYFKGRQKAANLQERIFKSMSKFCAMDMRYNGKYKKMFCEFMAREILTPLMQGEMSCGRGFKDVVLIQMSQTLLNFSYPGADAMGAYLNRLIFSSDKDLQKHILSLQQLKIHDELEQVLPIGVFLLRRFNSAQQGGDPDAKISFRDRVYGAYLRVSYSIRSILSSFSERKEDKENQKIKSLRDNAKIFIRSGSSVTSNLIYNKRLEFFITRILEPLSELERSNHLLRHEAVAEMREGANSIISHYTEMDRTFVELLDNPNVNLSRLTSLLKYDLRINDGSQNISERKSYFAWAISRSTKGWLTGDSDPLYRRLARTV